MGLILKCALFFILSVIVAIPLHIIASILGESLGASNVDFVSVIFVSAITSYPLYEYFYIRKKRSDNNKQDKIKAYCKYFKTIRYTRFARGFVIFAISLLVAGSFTYILASFNPYFTDDQETAPFAVFMLILICSNFLLRQSLYFGLPKELSFFDNDEILISESDYIKIEQDILDINKRRRLYMFSGLFSIIISYFILNSININYLTLFFIIIVALCASAVLLHYFKINIEKSIFPYITDTKNIQLSLNVRHIPDVIHPKQLIHHFSKKELEGICSESYLEQRTSTGKKCQIWELKLPKTILMISIELDKEYESTVFLSTKKLKSEEYREIPNNTFQFGDIFHLYGEDNVLAYDVMTPILQEHLLKLIAGVNAFELIVQIHKNEMLVTMTCGEDLFNIGSILRPVTLESINKTIAEVRLIRSLPSLIDS